MMGTMWQWFRELVTAVTLRAAVGRLRGLVERLRSPGPVMRRAAAVLSITTVAVVGIVLGTLIGARTTSDVGPFSAELQITPSLTGGADVQIPPLGSLALDSHDGPAHVSLKLGNLDQGRTQALVADPEGIVRASDTAVQDVETGLTRLALRTLAATLLGALALAALVFRNLRRVAITGALALGLTAASLGVAVGTFRPTAIQEPRYEGLLVNAPAVVGEAQRIADRYDEYRAQLQRLVRNVSRLYTTVSTLPVFEPDPSTTRVLHVSDLHLNPSAWSIIDSVVDQFDIDVVVDTGDITDWGTQQEASRYVSSIAALDVPYVYIRGNHDSAIVSAAVAQQPNAIVLENEVRSAAGLTFAGISDPRFTPDKETAPATPAESQKTMEQVLGTGGRLAETIQRSGQQVDVAMVHDPASADGLAGHVPVVLAGHTHARDVRTLSVNGEPPTLLMVEGSTGGAGLRGLEHEEPTPLTLSVLYFDETRTLQAYDDIRVGGTGLAMVTLERHVISSPPQPAPTGTPSPGPS
ncbi:MAG: metallophosphoesterase [Dactylosporangium sp.]|nr:metallophosphoesterase [Dactylosporangium sp.]